MSLSVRSKTQTGFKWLARISSPLPPLSTMGPIWQPAQWINQMWQTLHPACELCHRLLSHACLGLYLGPSQSSPRLLAWFPQLPAGTHFMLAVPLGETKRNWREGNQESSSKSWRSPWPRLCHQVAQESISQGRGPEGRQQQPLWPGKPVHVPRRGKLASSRRQPWACLKAKGYGQVCWDWVGEVGGCPE